MNRERVTKIAAVLALLGICLSIVSAWLLSYFSSNEKVNNTNQISQEELEKILEEYRKTHSGTIETTNWSIKIWGEINSWSVDTTSSWITLN